jgi:hypothetical protein
MDSIYPPLTEKQERALRRMELLRELRKPTPWARISPLVHGSPLFIGAWPWVRIIFVTSLAIIYLTEWKTLHSTLSVVMLTFWSLVLVALLIDQVVIRPMQKKVEAATELIEQELKTRL